MARLAAIVYSTDNFPLTKLAIEHLRRTVDPELTDIVMVDNGSKEEFERLGDVNIFFNTNIGGNAVFHTVPNFIPKQEYLAFLHCDLMVHEVGWDKRVVDTFDEKEKLGVLGFVGSNQIDRAGGRGLGTMLNYAGEWFPGIGQASPAEVHGRRVTDYHAAAVLDHCSMIFRRSTLSELTPQESAYAPEHFYDKIMCCEALEKGWWVGVLGISVDHFSGGIGDGSVSAERLRERWLDYEGIEYKAGQSHDAVYIESQRRFFERFGNFFPLEVTPEHEIRRL